MNPLQRNRYIPEDCPRFHAPCRVIVKAITGATKANPCVITCPHHGLAGLDPNTGSVRIAGALGMTELNDLNFTIAAEPTDPCNKFQLVGVDSTEYTPYVSGGTAAQNRLPVDQGDTSAVWNGSGEVLEADYPVFGDYGVYLPTNTIALFIGQNYIGPGNVFSFWLTPDWNYNDNVEHTLLVLIPVRDGSANSYIGVMKTDDNKLVLFFSLNGIERTALHTYTTPGISAGVPCLISGYWYTYGPPANEDWYGKLYINGVSISGSAATARASATETTETKNILFGSSVEGYIGDAQVWDSGELNGYVPVEGYSGQWHLALFNDQRGQYGV